MADDPTPDTASDDGREPQLRPIDPELESHVTRLFDRYRQLCDDGAEPDAEEFVRRAPPANAQELRQRIGVYEKLHELKREITPARPPLPERLGRFEIRSSLGRGGLAQVYLAFDPELGREVALKVLDRGVLAASQERGWILNEARSLATLEHPGVVRVFEVGHADGYDFVAMEHLVGPTLHEVIVALSRLDGPEGTNTDGAARARSATRIARRIASFRARAACFHHIASALAYCHNRGVVHRDVKPTNIIFGDDDRPKLIDFGLAHLAASEEPGRPQITQHFVGSPEYFAPEQVEANQTGADPRSDQFSLAVSFYEALRLANPFRHATSLETLKAVERCDFPDLRRAVARIPHELATIVHHGLERDPDARYATVQELADDLAAFLDHRPLSIEPPSSARRALLWTRRHWLRVTVAAALLLTLSGTLFLSWLSDVTGERAAVIDALAAMPIEGLEQEEEFWESGLELLSLRERASAFDARFGALRVSDSLTPRLQAQVVAWSDRLASALPTRTKRTSEMWPFLLRIERELCPDCTANTRARERGMVVLPREAIGDRPWELQRMVRPESEHDVFLELYEPLELETPLGTPPQLPLGTYRLLVWNPERTETVYDHVFAVSRLRALKRELRPERRDRPLFGADSNPLLAESVLVESTTFERAPRGSDHTVPAFRILPRHVTGGEFEAFLEHPAYERYLAESERAECAWFPLGDERDTVWVDLDVAMAFAAWVGGRLPSLAELVAAADADVLEPGQRTGREWTLNESWPNSSPEGTFFHWLRHRRGTLENGYVNAISRETLVEPGDAGGVVFRVVFPER